MFSRSLNPLKSNSFFIFGARGTGKTTFLKHEFEDSKVLRIDLLENQIFSELLTKPEKLESIIQTKNTEWVVIDEIQRIPALLNEVHRLIEAKNLKFILTGSSARKLKRGAANLLAGRAFVYKMFPLTHKELDQSFDLDSVLAYGSLPRIFSFSSSREKTSFLRSYVDTYLKEEILIEQIIRNLPPFRKFLDIAACQDTEIVSYSNLAKDISVDPKIVSNYYDILEDTLLGFRLEPYHTSIRKKQKKSPKFYFFDLGVRRALAGSLDLGLQQKSFEYGSLFESFIVNEIYRILSYAEKQFSLSFLRIDEQNEIDLILERKGLPTYLIEIKSTDRVHEGHIHNLKLYAKDFKNSVPVLLSQDPLVKKLDGVLCLPWKKAFEEMGLP